MWQQLIGGKMNSSRAQDHLFHSVLDIDELSERCLGRLELVEKVLHRFHEAMDPELKQLEHALVAADFDAIAGIAHRIKGTSVTVAAHGLTNCAQQLESAARSECHNDIKRSVSNITEEWQRLSEIVATRSRGV